MMRELSRKGGDDDDKNGPMAKETTSGSARMRAESTSGMRQESTSGSARRVQIEDEADHEDALDEPLLQGRSLTGITHVIDELEHSGVKRTSTEDVVDSLFPDVDLEARNVEEAIMGYWLSKVVMITIAINCIEIGVKCQWPAPVGSFSAHIHTYLQAIFAVVYVIEVYVKMRVLGMCQYFELAGSMVDFVVTGFAVLELLLGRMEAAGYGPYAKLKMLSLLRLLRIFRMLRLFKNIPELATTIDGLNGSIRTLLWVVLVLTLCVFAFSVYFVHVIERPESEYFKDLFTGMRTLIAVVMGDVWTEVFVRGPGAQENHANYNEEVHPILLYVPFYTFALLAMLGIINIIVGVIVDATSDTKIKLQWASQRKKLLRMGAIWEEEIHAKKLGRDTLTKLSGEELAQAQRARRDVVRSICDHILKEEESIFPPGMLPDELRLLLDAQGDGRLNHQEFCVGLGRLLLCNPTQQRVLQLMNQAYTRRRAAQNNEVIKDIQARMGRLERRLEEVNGAVHEKMDEVLQEVKALQPKRRWGR